MIQRIIPSWRRNRAVRTNTSSLPTWRQTLILFLLLLIAACSSGPEESPATANQTKASSSAQMPDGTLVSEKEIKDLTWSEAESQRFAWFCHEPQHEIFDPRADWYYLHSQNQSFESLFYGSSEPMHVCYDPKADWYFYHTQNTTFESLFHAGPDSMHSVHDPALDITWRKKLASLKKKTPSIKKPKIFGKTPEEQFKYFADYWLDKINRNFPDNPSRIKVTGENGGYVARYRIAEKESLNLEVKPSKSSTVPFVGIMRYLEHLYKCEARTEEDARKGPFQIEKRLKMTEIFSYANGNWRE